MSGWSHSACQLFLLQACKSPKFSSIILLEIPIFLRLFQTSGPAFVPTFSSGSAGKSGNSHLLLSLFPA